MPRPLPLHRLVLGLAVLLVTFAATAPAAAGDLELAYFQGLVGAAAFDEDKLRVIDPALGNAESFAEDDLSTLPCLGVAAQFAFVPTASHVGLETSALFSWHSDSTTAAAGNGRARIEIDSDLWLLDLSVGLYAQTVLGQNWRLYGAFGPVMLYGDYSDDTTTDDPEADPQTVTTTGSDTAFGVGGYARLGLEYQISPGALVGLAVRGVATNLEFDDAVEDGGLTGVQGFVTFTRAY
jgi:hypothetical protein